MKAQIPTAINLASDPFRRERADTAAFVVVCAALLCSLFILSGLILHSRAQASDVRRQIEGEQAQLTSLQHKQNGYLTVLSRPENGGTFAYSVFLNQIIARRGVSWTRVFQDLGTVMPANVRLLAVRLPQIDSEDDRGANRVQLDMFVGTTQPEAIIGLFKNLQKSSVFGAASIVTQNPPSQNDPLYKYRVAVPYDQQF